MITNRKAGLVLIVIFTMMVNFTVNALDQDMTRHIENTDQDKFVLDTGLAIDANFLTVLSPDMDIRGMLFFENIKINSWERLTNATLRLRTFQGRSFEADSTITIYGVRDYAQLGYSSKLREAPQSPSAILSLPITRAHVDYNTSQFYGPQWWEIDVTSLVNEMKNDPHYDGPGSNPSDLGDNMIFTIYGAEGFEARSFYDFKSGNNLEAQLVLHWTDSPPHPPGIPPTAEYVNSSGGWDIWSEYPWFNFSTFDVIGSKGAKITGRNDTFFQVTNMYALSDVYLRRDYGEYRNNDTQYIHVKFGLEWEGLPWTGPAAYEYVNMFGVSTDHALAFQFAEGYTFSERTWTNRAMGTAWSVDGALRSSVTWNPQWMETALPWTIYYDLYLNMDTGVFNVTLYNDIEMTDLNTTFNDVFTLRPAYPFTLQYEYLIAPTTAGTQQVGWTGKYYSLTEEEGSDLWIVDPTTNETLPVPDIDGDGDIDQDDARTLIGDTDPQPGDPAPGQSWAGTEDTVFSRFRIRLYILLIGVGLVFGPLLIFAASRPSGYEFTIGMFVMLIGFALMYAAGQV